MIKPEGIPLLAAVQPDTVDDEAGNLKKTAGEIRSTGANVHSSWQGLAGFYHAPEAPQLFAATEPVRTRTDTFADQLERVTTALTAYAAEVRPIKHRLSGLSGRAWAFKSKADAKGDDWDKDEDLVQENNDLVNQVGAQVMAFQAAQDRAAAAIYASYGAAPPTAQKGQEGKATEPPWGTPEKGDLPWYKDVLNGAGSLFKGVFVDGLGGDLTGLWDLVTSPGKWWDTFKTIMALSVPLLPFGFTLLAIPAVREKFVKSWKDFGKSFVAWDEWKKDPARAFGNTLYNVLTIGVPYAKAGSAGKIAKAADAANKTADALDPLSLAAKGAGKIPKVGEIAHAFDFRAGSLLGEIKLDLGSFRIADPELPANPDRTPDLDGTPDFDRVPEPVGASGHEINAPDPPPREPGAAGPNDPGTPGPESRASSGGQGSGKDPWNPKIDEQLNDPDFRKDYFQDRTSENGGLWRRDSDAVDQDGYPVPRARFNQETGRYEPLSEDPVPAQFKDEPPPTRGHSSTEQIGEMRDTVERRQEAQEQFGSAQNDVDRETARAIRDGAGEEIGERAAEYAVRHEYRGHYGGNGDATIEQDPRLPTEAATPPGEHFDKRFRFDQVWTVRDPVTGETHYVVVEAKGSRAALGGADGLDGIKYQQGHPKYFEKILFEMQKRGGPEKALARDLMNAYKAGRLDYVMVRGLVKKIGGSDVYDGYMLKHFNLGGG